MNRIHLTIEGIEMVILTAQYERAVLIEFCTKKSVEDDTDFYCFNAMLGFKNPIAALKQLGKAALELAAMQEKPVYFTGCDSKRHRVYGKMLSKAGINVIEEIDVEGDISWRIIR